MPPPSPPPSPTYIPSINIPYIKGTSENIKRICQQYNIRVSYGKFRTLRSVVTKVKPSIDKLHTKNCVYNIVCTCGMSYTGETKRPLTVRIEEHKKAVAKGETHKSKLAEHIWNANGEHVPLWNDVKIVDRERCWKERKLKETAHIILSPTCISQTSAELNPMWLPLLMKGNY